MRTDDQSLPFRITFEHRPEYLYAYVEGDNDSYDVSIAYWKLTASEARTAGYRKVLVDENIAGVVTMAEMYQVASDLAAVVQGIKIAYVDRFADQAELNEFGELVAQNRGIVGRFFVDIAEAEAWLLEQ